MTHRNEDGWCQCFSKNLLAYNFQFYTYICTFFNFKMCIVFFQAQAFLLLTIYYRIATEKVR